ncbi:MAG: SDR family oxidoreductase [Spirochaetota bacterium]|nr:SDR family oxidoreductase [Spirochaetota bacterium]
MSIHGKTALVTGAAHRLGAASAEALAAGGCGIVLHYHSSEHEAMQTARRIEAAGAELYMVQQDLGQPESAEELTEKVLDLGVSPDILVNSAGSYPRTDFARMQWNDLESALKLNSFAPFALSRAFSRLPRASCIVNVLDARMVDYDQHHLAYHLSKRLLHDLTRVLSCELAPDIRVNGIAPGIILPDRPDDPVLIEKYRQATLLKRIGTPEEYVQALLFLITNEFVTGQVIFVDGGRHLRGRFYGS